MSTASSNVNVMSGFAPILRETKGSLLLDIEGAGRDEQTGALVPRTSRAGNEYYTLVFEDNCRFNLSVSAIMHLTSPEMPDGTPNQDFLERGIYPGMKLSATRVKSGEHQGRPVVKYV